MNISIQTKETFWILFKGDITDSQFLFSYFLFGIGVIIYTLARIINRRDQKTKPSFEIWFSHKNNKLELILSIFVMYIQVRFAEAYEGWLLGKLPDGFKLVPYFVMVISGFAQHYIIVNLLKVKKKIEESHS